MVSSGKAVGSSPKIWYCWTEGAGGGWCGFVSEPGLPGSSFVVLSRGDCGGCDTGDDIEEDPSAVHHIN